MKIITHSGNFHPDEIMGVATLLMIFGDDVDIIRTRDLGIINGKEKDDIVLDVGLKYDPVNNYYDHHQNGGADARPVNNIPYASFGLIWKHFGDKLVGSKKAYEHIEEKMVLPIDAGDNGIDTFQKANKFFKPYLFGGALISFLPTWEEKEENINVAFLKAVNMGKLILEREIIKANAFVNGEAEVEKAYAAATDKRLILLDNNYSWRDIMTKYPEPLFVIMNDTQQTTWAVMSVKVDGVSFKSRKLFPESWAGKTGKDLAEATGVSDANFCHKGRFIAVANSREGAMKLAELALAA